MLWRGIPVLHGRPIGDGGVPLGKVSGRRTRTDARSRRHPSSSRPLLWETWSSASCRADRRRLAVHDEALRSTRRHACRNRALASGSPTCGSQALLGVVCDRSRRAPRPEGSANSTSLSARDLSSSSSSARQRAPVARAWTRNPHRNRRSRDRRARQPAKTSALQRHGSCKTVSTAFSAGASKTRQRSRPRFRSLRYESWARIAAFFLLPQWLLPDASFSSSGRSRNGR